MKFYGNINVQEGTNEKITNLVLDSGTSDPSNPDAGELFFRTDLNTLRIYNGSGWNNSSQWTTSGNTIYYNNGDVGIGVNPTVRLHVYSTSEVEQILECPTVDSKAILSLKNDARKWSVLVDGTNSDALVINDTTSGTIPFRITTVGNVGIGVTPVTKLHTYSTSQNHFTIQRDNTGTNMEIGGIIFSSGAGNTDRAAILAHTPSSDNNGSLTFYTQPTSGSLTERLKISETGNFGFSTTDIEAWNSSYRAFQMGSHNAIMYGNALSEVYFLNNLYNNGGFFARTTGASMLLQMVSGAFEVKTAPSATIDTAPTLTTVLSISNNGNMIATVGSTAGNGITINGTSSPKLRVADTGSSVYLDCQVDGATTFIGSGSNHPLVLRVNNTEYARLNTSNNWGFRTSDIEAWDNNYKAIHFGPYANIFHGVSVTGLFLCDNTYYDGQQKYRSTNSATMIAVNNGVDITTAVSGTIDTVITLTSQLTVYGTGTLGVTVGNPTGGPKGLGTINAQAVYDDNVILTCYPFDQYLDSIIDMNKWDAKVPNIIHKDKDGNIISTTIRTHEYARKFKARIGTVYDPLTLDGYAKHWKEKRHLTSLPNEVKYDINAKLDMGNWVQRLIETCEIQAILIETLNQKIKNIERILNI